AADAEHSRQFVAVQPFAKPFEELRLQIPKPWRRIFQCQSCRCNIYESVFSKRGSKIRKRLEIGGIEIMLRIERPLEVKPQFFHSISRYFFSGFPQGVQKANRRIPGNPAHEIPFITLPA